MKGRAQIGEHLHRHRHLARGDPAPDAAHRRLDLAPGSIRHHVGQRPENAARGGCGRPGRQLHVARLDPGTRVQWAPRQQAVGGRDVPHHDDSDAGHVRHGGGARRHPDDVHSRCRRRSELGGDAAHWPHQKRRIDGAGDRHVGAGGLSANGRNDDGCQQGACARAVYRVARIHGDPERIRIPLHDRGGRQKRHPDGRAPGRSGAAADRLHDPDRAAAFRVGSHLHMQPPNPPVLLSQREEEGDRDLGAGRHHQRRPGGGASGGQGEKEDGERSFHRSLGYLGKGRAVGARSHDHPLFSIGTQTEVVASHAFSAADRGAGCRVGPRLGIMAACRSRPPERASAVSAGSRTRTPGGSTRTSRW